MIARGRTGQHRVAHLADDAKPTTTLCGLPWEDWQNPDMPTDAEIGFDDLDYGTRVLVRQADEQRRPRPGDRVEQCQACFKSAMNRQRAVSGG